MASTKLSTLRSTAPAVADEDDLVYGVRVTTEHGLTAGDIANINKEKYIGANKQTGTAYTLVLADAGKIVEMNNIAANVLTIPANAAVAFPINTRIDIVQYGAGVTSVAITTDTLRGELVSQGQYKPLSLWKRAATEWIIFGGTT